MGRPKIQGYKQQKTRKRNPTNKLKANQNIKIMVTVQEWVGREVHDGIVFTLGPGHLLRRMWRGRTHWREAGSPLAAPPSLARPPNWTNNAAGRPGLPQQTLRLTCCVQKRYDSSSCNIMQLLNVLVLLTLSLSPVTVC